MDNAFPLSRQATTAGLASDAASTVSQAAYGRFSTDLQRDTSIDDQIAQCRSKLDANDHIPDHLVFKDQGISGTSMHNRTG